MTTLEDIRKHMLNYLIYDTTNSDEVKYGICYDDYGHCSDSLYDSIRSFWENFDSDEKFKYVVSGEYDSDDLDLEGGRDYLLTHSNVMPLMFDYMANTLGWNKYKFDSVIYNTLTFNEELGDMFNSKEEIEEKNEETITEVDYVFIPRLVKYPSKMKSVLDNTDTLRFFSKSRINDDLIYEIKKIGCKIPKGYEIILPVEY